MLKVRSLVGVAAALIATPLMGLPAWGVPMACVAGSITDYANLGSTGCTVGVLTFSNVLIVPTGNVTLGNMAVNPFNQDGEMGLSLSFSASANTTQSADITWQMDVTGPGISDAFAFLQGSVTDGGQAKLQDTIFTISSPLTQLGQINLALPNPSSQTIFFPAQPGVFVAKDQHDFISSNPLGSSETSLLINAFSVPGPVVGAGLPGLVAACGGLIGLARRRRRQIA
jgi:hypothetical protein